MMPKNLKITPKVREVLPEPQVRNAFKDLSNYLLEHFDVTSPDVALVGIHSRGVTLAERLAQQFKKEKGADLPVGALDITLYRDDFSTAGIQTIVGETKLNFDIDNKKIILIDDVLFTGRTIRAALDELMDFGRPQSITLVVLIDRGHRELPIQADYAPLSLPTQRNESVNLHLKELDNKDEIVICEPLDE